MIVYIEVDIYHPETGNVVFQAFTPGHTGYRDQQTRYMRAGEKHEFVGQQVTYRVWQDTRSWCYYPMSRVWALKVVLAHRNQTVSNVDLGS